MREALLRDGQRIIADLFDYAGLSFNALYLDRMVASVAPKLRETLDGITRSTRTHYGRYRQEGLSIGSAVVEASCKTVVGRRLKQSEMFWSQPSAENTLSLCSLVLVQTLDAARKDLKIAAELFCPAPNPTQQNAFLPTLNWATKPKYSTGFPL